MTDKKSAVEKLGNPFDDSPDKVEQKQDNKVVETDEKKAGTAQDKPAAPVEPEEKPKTPRKRRTKAEIEADKAEEGEEVDFDRIDFEKLPLSAVSGQIVGSVSLNQGAVPTLNIALLNWIGEAPIAVAASQIGDVEAVIADLKKQAKAARRS